MTRALTTAMLVLVLALLSGCVASRQAEGPSLARGTGWNWEIVPAGAFEVAVAMPSRGAGGTLVVYLEGDGFAYAHPDQPSGDPTPTDPIALRMALADPTSRPVAWIGRPCQYTLPDHGRHCAKPYWTTHRYAPEMVDGIGTALDLLKRRAEASRLVLVGYSGGGAVAVLLAARRSDVDKVVTVAANLDLAYWTRRDRLVPLAGSLDPAGVAGAMGTIPQVHLTGGRDRTVGTDVVRSYMAALPAGTPARLVEIPDFTHACCWARDWTVLATEF